jgi:hypothetical protein
MAQRCALKRGFFLLRDCGQPTEDSCTECARPICQDHATRQQGQPICLECQAKQAEVEGDYDRQWAYAYRHRYYTTHTYHPFYVSTYYDHYYDDYDVRAFDRETSVPLDIEDDTAGGFFES